MNERISTITKSEPVKVDYFPKVNNLLTEIIKIERPEAPILDAKINLSLWEKIKLSTIIIYNLIKVLIKIKGAEMSEDTKGVSSVQIGRYIKGALAIIASILLFFGVELTIEMQTAILSGALAIWGVIELFIGKKAEKVESK